jgi:hypothetical protein
MAKDESDVPRRAFAAAPKKRSYFLCLINNKNKINYFFHDVFGRFIPQGVQKHDKTCFRKNPSGLITNFFSSVFFPPLSRVFCSIFVYRVCWRFVTSGVQKRDKTNHGLFSAAAKKNTYLLASLFFSFPAPPLAGPGPGTRSQNQNPASGLPYAVRHRHLPSAFRPSAVRL